MATAVKERIALSDDDLERLLGLMKGADSTELKLTVPESDQRSTVKALGMDAARRSDPPSLLLRYS